MSNLIRHPIVILVVTFFMMWLSAQAGVFFRKRQKDLSGINFSRPTASRTSAPSGAFCEQEISKAKRINLGLWSGRGQSMFLGNPQSAACANPFTNRHFVSNAPKSNGPPSATSFPALPAHFPAEEWALPTDNLI
jgi:hypothetical protein